MLAAVRRVAQAVLNVDPTAQVVFDQASTGTYAGVMTGSGGLSKQGTAALVGRAVGGGDWPLARRTAREMGLPKTRKRGGSVAGRLLSTSRTPAGLSMGAATQKNGRTLAKKWASRPTR